MDSSRGDVRSITGPCVTPLVYAAEYGDLETVKWHVQKGSDLNQVKLNHTAVSMAAKSGHVDILQLLIDNGAKVTPPSGRLSALYWACQAGQVHCAQILLENEPSENYFPLVPAIAAMEHGHLGCLKVLLEYRAKNLARAELGREPTNEELKEFMNKAVLEKYLYVEGLSKAITNHHWNVVKYMLDFDINVNLICADNDQSPGLLDLAVKNGRPETVAVLLRKGAWVNGVKLYKPSEEPGKGKHSLMITAKKTPLMAAAEKGSLEILQMLCENGADVNLRTLDTYSKRVVSAVFYAAKEGHTECLQYLLDKNPHKQEMFSSGYLAILETMCRGNELCLELMLNRGFSATAKHDREGLCRYALSEACQGGHLTCAKLLLKRGANANAQDHLGTALVYAVRNKHFEVVEMLLEVGVDVNCKDGKHGALWYAAQHGEVEVVRKLLSLGVDPNARGDNGETPIFIAADLGHTQCLNEILSHKQTSVNILNSQGCTAIVAAIRNKKLDCVSALLAANLDPNLFGASEIPKNQRRRRRADVCPLIWAVQEDYPSCVEFLLSHGADPYLKISLGNSFQWAVAERRPDCLRALLEYDQEASKAKKAKESSWLFQSVFQALKKLTLESKRSFDCDKDELLSDCFIKFVGPKCIELLLFFGADVNYEHKRWGYVLDIAVENGHTDGVKVLLRHNADIKCVFSLNECLTVSCIKPDFSEDERLRMCRLLLAAGCRPKEHYEEVPENLEDFQDIVAFRHSAWTLLQLCRACVRKHLLRNYVHERRKRMFKGNMFGVAPQLPLPTSIIEYLLYGEDVETADW